MLHIAQFVLMTLNLMLSPGGDCDPDPCERPTVVACPEPPCGAPANESEPPGEAPGDLLACDIPPCAESRSMQPSIAPSAEEVDVRVACEVPPCRAHSRVLIACESEPCVAIAGDSQLI